ncbi:riboflavin synthase subunit alpha [Synechocystis sp. LKSZ1]|uniref:riboflavin synthase subunit alpha n=1 Tax=Synechocystis sp. LKSZ1 TaxID=3144951 RepID=UPI00336BD323
MVVLSLVSLVVAFLSAAFCLNIREEVVRAALGCVAILSLLLTLVCAPWALKLTLIAIPIGLERFYHWSSPHPLD